MSRSASSSRRWRILAFSGCLVGILLFALWPSPPEIPYLASDGGQHAAAFAILTLAARACWPVTSGWRLFFALASFGLAIEVLQGLLPTGRAAELRDWQIDCVAIGVMLALDGVSRKVRGWLRRVIYPTGVR